jgi:hypothetical protein
MEERGFSVSYEEADAAPYATGTVLAQIPGVGERPEGKDVVLRVAR